MVFSMEVDFKHTVYCVWSIFYKSSVTNMVMVKNLVVMVHKFNVDGICLISSSENETK